MNRSSRSSRAKQAHDSLAVLLKSSDCRLLKKVSVARRIVVLVSVKNVIENSERTRTRTHEHDSSEAIERAT